MGIFDEQVSRKPNRYPWTEKYVKAMHQGFWTDDKFTFSSDIQDFKVNMTDEERETVVRALSAIGQVEIAVKTFWSKLGDNLPHPAMRDLGIVMGHIEVIHNNAYERLLEELGLEEIFEKNLKIDIIKNRINYLYKYNHRFYKESKKQYIYALILFTLFVENVSLFSQFYVINWFGRFKNILKDTNQQTQYTRNEETIHALVGIELINTIRQEYPELFDEELEEKVLHEAEQAFKYEFEIIKWMINGFDRPGLNADILGEFIKYRINESLKQIGFKKVFDVNPELVEETKWFQEEILANNNNDFFHTHSVNYTKHSEGISAEDLF